MKLKHHNDIYYIGNKSEVESTVDQLLRIMDYNDSLYQIVKAVLYDLKNCTATSPNPPATLEYSDGIDAVLLPKELVSKLNNIWKLYWKSYKTT